MFFPWKKPIIIWGNKTLEEFQLSRRWSSKNLVRICYSRPDALQETGTGGVVRLLATLDLVWRARLRVREWGEGCLFPCWWSMMFRIQWYIQHQNKIITSVLINKLIDMSIWQAAFFITICQYLISWIMLHHVCFNELMLHKASKQKKN